MWMVLILVPRMPSSRSMVQRYLSARLSRQVRTSGPSASGGVWPVFWQKAAIREGMSPWDRNDGSSGSIRAVNGFDDMAIAMSCS